MSSLSKRSPAWIAELKNRYFWGMPHTETDIAAFKKAIAQRAEADAVTPGRFAAVKHVEVALDRVTRWSGTLLIADTLLTMLILLLSYRTGADTAPAFVQLTRWAFALALAATVILCTNLRLVWASDAARFYADPDESYTLHLNVYKGRAWRYTVAVVLSFLAFACVLGSITQMK
jgi:hypothetical protein